MSETTPDLRLLEDVVAPRVLAAMRSASRAVTSLGVRHAVADLKLKSPRLKDRADVVELVKAGLSVESVRQYLERYAPPLVARFDECIAQVRAEEE